MFSAYANTMKIPELRKRIFFTLWIVAICRLVCIIPCPGGIPGPGPAWACIGSGARGAASPSRDDGAFSVAVAGAAAGGCS